MASHCKRENLQERYLQIISSQRQGWIAGCARVFLGCLSVLYQFVVSVRNWAYDHQVLESQKLRAPVLSIGNLTAGGTGKTPVVQFLAAWLKQQGFFPGIATRGYKAAVDLEKNHCVSDGKTIFLNSGDAGDEAYQLARNLPEIPVWIGADRFASGEAAVRENSVDVLLLDDGFQHRKLFRDLDLVLIDALCPWGFGYVFPRGLLRETKEGLKRADLILITRSDLVTKEQLTSLKKEIRRYNAKATLVETSHQPKKIWSLTENCPASFSKEKKRRVHLFCGLGNPAGFFYTASQMGFLITGHTVFPDHHLYSKEDMKQLVIRAKEEGAEILLTSEKDGVKLGEFLHLEMPIWQIEIEVAFGNEEETVKNVIMEKLK